jgi:phenylpyruvate tautomerase PptA (4-oxalocrotonate tautomerase family)
MSVKLNVQPERIHYMSQVTIFGNRDRLYERRQSVSDAIHASLVVAIGLPPEKRFHRFVGFDRENFMYPADRREDYTIIEISMFEGRSADSKKQLIRLLFENLQRECGLDPQDVEITIFETPRANWGIRGVPGDELGLSYKVEV